MTVPSRSEDKQEAVGENTEVKTEIPYRIQQNRDDKLKKFHNQLRLYEADTTKLIIHEHPEINNVEYIFGKNLELGIEDFVVDSDQPQVIARNFLRKLEPIFGLHSLRWRLFQKHMIKSQLGKHYIFGLRDLNNAELAENYFAVHLDHQNHVVFLTAVYQSDRPENFDQEAKPQAWRTNFPKQVQKKERQILQQEPISAYDYESGKYVNMLQQKSIGRDGRNFSSLLHPDGNIYSENIVHAQEKPNRLGLGKIYRRLWSDDFDQVFPPKDKQFLTQDVVLPDLLEANGFLRGIYAFVSDTDNDWRTSDFRLQNEPDLNNSSFDRVMAYYHLDKVQRFFRELGLDALDEYEQFNPMSLFLGSDSSHYSPYKGQIRLQKINGAGCTDALDARIIYHEFVHAITDAFTRLRRQEQVIVPERKVYPRRDQVGQAIAMDEGLADYFACSLAARGGAIKAEIGSFILDKGANPVNPFLRLTKPSLKWGGKKREISNKEGQAKPFSLKLDQRKLNNKNESQRQEVYYEWGTQWARFLWHLRYQLGPSVADTIIANSILFLHRWATFSLGVLAIIVADHLLFAGMHEDVIRAAVNYPQAGLDWKADWKEY